MVWVNDFVKELRKQMVKYGRKDLFFSDCWGRVCVILEGELGEGDWLAEIEGAGEALQQEQTGQVKHHVIIFT